MTRKEQGTDERSTEPDERKRVSQVSRGPFTVHPTGPDIPSLLANPRSRGPEYKRSSLLSFCLPTSSSTHGPSTTSRASGPFRRVHYTEPPARPVGVHTPQSSLQESKILSLSPCLCRVKDCLNSQTERPSSTDRRVPGDVLRISYSQFTICGSVCPKSYFPPATKIIDFYGPTPTEGRGPGSRSLLV